MNELDKLRRELAKAKGELDCNESTYERVFCIDTSDSMGGQKIICAKLALEHHRRDGDGLVAFGSTVHVLPIKHATFVTNGMTAMLPAIQKALSFNPLQIILITDGMPNVSDQYGTARIFECWEKYVDEILDFAHTINGVRIDTISIGREHDEDFNFDFLQKVSDITGGKNIHIETPEQLKGAIALITADAGSGAGCGSVITL